MLGRFVPDFGRVVAQMQYDMYHTYTVDEHTLFALGILHRIETGKAAETLPLATQVMRKTGSRRALYVALLCHDIAKGRGGDHSVLGARRGAQARPPLRPDAGGDRDRAVAGALAPAAQRHRLQARHRGRQDGAGLRRRGGKPGAAAPAAGADRRRHQRRRPRPLDRLEGDADVRAVPPGRGAAVRRRRGGRGRASRRPGQGPCCARRWRTGRRRRSKPMPARPAAAIGWPSTAPPRPATPGWCARRRRRASRWRSTSRSTSSAPWPS